MAHHLHANTRLDEYAHQLHELRGLLKPELDLSLVLDDNMFNALGALKEALDWLEQLHEEYANDEPEYWYDEQVGQWRWTDDANNHPVLTQDEAEAHGLDSRGPSYSS
jgi:hypothetical protein